MTAAIIYTYMDSRTVHGMCVHIANIDDRSRLIYGKYFKIFRIHIITCHNQKDTAKTRNGYI